MNKFICVHGHFYQPPRENPWLEAVELQDSAAPYHDWNERVTAECYAPNAHARLMHPDNRIDAIVSNYSRMSFNFGPTLLSWMKEAAPDIHEAIVQADQESRKRFSGHGSALAQCYNHLIMPLANRADKFTQVFWGIRDFESRFGRTPEGMWLPETAADNETLDVLAELGIKFTILSPYQASRVRPLGGADKNWQDVNGGRVNPLVPYQVKLESGRTIAVFFYHGPIAQAVAFERLMQDGGAFAGRLLNSFDPARKEAQLVHVATDGESYGHHHRYGELALAYALHTIEQNPDVKLTVYAEYLEKHPPQDEVQIHQSSAWSCAHGVDRWKKHCGCNSGGRPGWNQNWRAPLRESLDWLRDQLIPAFEEKAKEYLKDPWAARNAYINVICDRSTENLETFLRDHATRTLDDSEQVTVLRLLEMQRHALLMYTSCGWFFDDVSGIETVQVIRYAARAIQLASDLLDVQLESGFIDIISRAHSNVPDQGNGSDIYKRYVKPSIMTHESVGAHYAVSSLFRSYEPQSRIYSFNVEQLDSTILSAGTSRLAIGRIRVTFNITRNSSQLLYAALHLGEHNVSCGVRRDGVPEDFTRLVEESKDPVEKADFPEIVRVMDRHFGRTDSSLETLFRDEQHRVLGQILSSARADTFNTYRLITERYGALLRLLARIGAKPPKSLYMAAEYVLNRELENQFESDKPDRERVRQLLAECEASRVVIDRDALNYSLKRHMDHLAEQLDASHGDLQLLQQLLDMATWLRSLPFEVNIWKVQNIFYVLYQTFLPEMKKRAQNSDIMKPLDKGAPLKDTNAEAEAWVKTFVALGEQLGFRMEA